MHTYGEDVRAKANTLPVGVRELERCPRNLLSRLSRAADDGDWAEFEIGGADEHVDCLRECVRMSHVSFQPDVLTSRS